MWAPDINERVTVSYPPVIDRARVSPDPDELFTFASGTTPSMTFSVVGALADPDSDIEKADYYWFIDHPDPKVSGYPIASGNGANKTFSINPCSIQFKSLLDSTKLHLLELFVIDDNGSLSMTGGERVLNGQFAHVAWLLKVEAGVCP